MDNNINNLSDDELSKVLLSLEDAHPKLNRLPDWKLIGFVENKNTGKHKAPIWVKTWHEKSKYSCEKLRELRSERGVGKKKRKGRIITDKMGSGVFGTKI